MNTDELDLTVQDPEDRNSLAKNRERSTTSSKKKLLALLVVIVGILIILGGLFFFYKNIKSRSSGEVFDQSEAFLQNSAYNDNSLNDRMAKIKREEENKRREQEQAEQERLKKEEAKKMVSEKLNGSQPSNTTANNKTTVSELTPFQRKKMGNILYGTNDNSTSEFNNNNDSLNNMLVGDVYPDGSVKSMEDLSSLLISGTTIPCVLQTKIITNYPSFLKCMVTQNIYSSNGEKMLFPKGSIVKGEQKKALLQGVSRVFISWNIIDTPPPEQLRIRIDSLGTDKLGASGSEAYVDNHWFDRFGNAIILSLIQDSIKTASNRASNSGNNNDIYYDNSESNASRMAELALQNSINIPATGYVNHGELINILVVRDVDFSLYR